MTTQQQQPGSPEESEAIQGFAFGQREPLTVRLRGLIRSYPKGLGILKEFIQNADDAGATCAKIILDSHTYPSEHLPSPAMAALSGPSLIVFNDQLFSEQDIESIQEIGLGGKAQDVSKTGRFGLGFNTCYNVTDYPTLLTGGYLFFFDPHYKTIPGASADSPGQGWTLSEGLWRQYRDMLLPFRVVGLEPESLFFKGTAFRLPLRSAEQALHSEICSEPFINRDFQSILEQIVVMGPALLLFLKHLLSFQVVEVAPDGTTLRQMLHVTTENAADVQRERNKILNFLATDAIETLQKLKVAGSTAKPARYDHRIRVSRESREELQTWRVVNGLYLDKAGEMEAGVHQMQQFGEKALPWAGAACRVKAETSDAAPSSRPQGKLYCFLPLPIENPFPVHLHGFFDLDSSRQALMSDQSAVGKDAARVEWNKLLVKHCVAQAYADLIDCAQDICIAERDLYYALWPRTSTDVTGPLSGLPESVYQHLAERAVIPLAGSRKRSSVRDVRFVPPEWQAVYEPLIADKMSLPDQSLPSHIPEGFEAAGVAVMSLTPQEVRNRLRVSADVDCELADAPRECLRQRRWVVDLLRYCLSDGNQRDLKGVPLVILGDGRLHTIGHFTATHAFFAGDRERRIFAGFPDWFVDSGFANETRLEPCIELNMPKMAASTVLLKLHQVLDFGGDGTEIDWNPESSTPPNEAWLQDLYEYLAAALGTGFKPTSDELRKLPIVPDQFGHLCCPGYTETPLLVNPDTDKNLVHMLSSLGVPLVTGTEGLLAATRRFSQTLSSGVSFVWGLTAHDIVDTIHAMADEWRQKAAGYDPAIHDTLLDFFSHPDQVADLGKNPQQKKKLKSLPLFLTYDKQLVSGELPGLYLPSDFIPPSVPLNVQWLNTGKAQRWRSLLELLDFGELDRPRLIRNILLPAYQSLSIRDQVKALSWIRDNLSTAETQLQQSNGASGEALHNAVAEAHLIRCTDGSLHPGKYVYNPEIQVIREVLGESAWIPDMSAYDRGKESWLRLFASLGMSDIPRPDDVLRYVDQLIEKAHIQGASAVSERIIRVLEHLVQYWSELGTASVADRQIGGRVVPLNQALSARAWLPAQRDPKRLARYPGFVIPDDRLYRAGELQFSRSAHLIASQCPIADIEREPEQAIRRALGFVESPPFAAVLKHFERVLDLWDVHEKGDSAAAALVTSLNSIYRYLGAVSDEGALRVLAHQFRDRACLLDEQGQRLWRAKHVFSEPVRLLEPQRIRLQFRSDTARDAGYRALGRRDQPEIDDYIEYLEERYEEAGTDPISSDQVDHLLRLLAHIGTQLHEYLREEPDLPVLTDDCRIVAASSVHEADAPWYQDRLERDKVNLLHSQVSRDVITWAKIKSLARSITERLAETPAPIESGQAAIECSRWCQTISSPEFERGLLRLMRTEWPSLRRDDLQWRRGLQVDPVATIWTELLLGQNGHGIPIGDAETEYYFDRLGGRIFLKAQTRQVMIHFLAEAINQHLGDLRLPDRSILIQIVDEEPADIDQLLTALRIPRSQETTLIPGEVRADVEDETDDEEGGVTPEMGEAENEWRIEGHDAGDVGEAEGAIPGEDFGKCIEVAVERSHTDEPASGLSAPSVPSTPSQDRRPPGDERGQDNSRGRPQPPLEGANRDSDRNPPMKGQTDLFGGSSTPSTREQGSDGRSSDTSTDRVHLQPESVADYTPSGEGPVNPPMKPGDGRAAARTTSTTRPQDRLLSYVAPRRDGDQEGAGDEPEDLTDDEQHRNLAIGRAAVERAKQYEKDREWDPDEKPHNNPGYDIESKSPSGEVRYIEVKGVDGPWDKAGVPVSPTQFTFAQNHREEFWLYVVEFARDEQRNKIYPIQNPTDKITQFRFDGGWKAVAETDIEHPAKPEPGMSVVLANGMIAKIMEVLPGGGEITRLVIQLPDGCQQRKVYEPGKMKLSRSGASHDG